MGKGGGGGARHLGGGMAPDSERSGATNAATEIAREFQAGDLREEVGGGKEGREAGHPGRSIRCQSPRSRTGWWWRVAPRGSLRGLPAEEGALPDRTVLPVDEELTRR